MTTPDDDLKFLAETDVEFGRLKGLYKALEFRLKIAEARGFVDAEGAQELRKAIARTSSDYCHLVQVFNETSIEFHTLEAQRFTAVNKIEVWRSVNASRNRGNI